jgi:hypothetical protein
MDNIIKFYTEIEDFEIKALIEDYTSVDIWVLQSGKVRHWVLEVFDEWSELPAETMTEAEFLDMVVNQSFVKILIDKR